MLFKVVTVPLVIRLVVAWVECLDAGVNVPVAGHQGHCQILSNVGRKAAGGAGDADAGFSVFESGTEIEAKGVRIVNGNL